jgi:putative nucleotidyltransferase with HDIG domain
LGYQKLEVIEIVSIALKITEEKAQRLMNSARAAMAQGNALDAVTSMQQACLELRTEPALAKVLALALSRLGIVLYGSNQYLSAIQVTNESVVLTQSLPDATAFDLAKAKLNFGTSLQAAGYFSEAQRVYDELLLTPDDLANLVSLVELNLAYCSLMKSDFASAILHAQIGLDRLAKESVDDQSRIEHESGFDVIMCESLIRTGRKKDALTRILIAAKKPGKRSVNAQAQHDVMRGLCEVVNGHADVGLSRLAQTLDHARSNGFSTDVALRAMISAHDALGNHAQSLVYIDELSKLMHSGATATARFASDYATALPIPEVNDFDHSIQTKAADTRVLRMLELAQAHSLPQLYQLAKAASLIDDETGRHCSRVGRLALAFARSLGYDEETSSMFSEAAQLHDIGKIGISHQLLLKPGKLSAGEFEIVKQHTVIGADILSAHEHPVAQLARTAARHHHERWDGTGYPEGLCADEIPFIAMFTSIVDVYDVMRSRRSYKRPQSHIEAIAELKFHSGKQFCPTLVEAFMNLPLHVLNGDGSYEA